MSGDTALVLRRRGLSLRLHRRPLAVCGALAAGILAIGLASLLLGEVRLGAGEILAGLAGEGRGAFILLELRLPRVLTAALAGAALGASGAILQSLARNPLASPDLLGFTQGAGLGAVAAIVGAGTSGWHVMLGALAGGLLTAAFALALAWKDGALRIWRLVLVGIGTGFILVACIQLMMVRTDLFQATTATRWLTGSLNARTWFHASVAGLGALVLLPAALAMGRALDLLAMGDDAAAGLGARVERARLGAAMLSVFLAAVAVSVAGPVAFVALAAGPLGRRLTGTFGTGVLPAALTGALMLAAADLAGRLLLSPVELPAGIFTAVFGAPYLLWLMAAEIRRGAL